MRCPGIQDALKNHFDNQDERDCQRGQGCHHADYPENKSEDEKAVSLEGELAPRLADLSLIQRHAVEEHEFAAAVEPGKEHPQCQT